MQGRKPANYTQAQSQPKPQRTQMAIPQPQQPLNPVSVRPAHKPLMKRKRKANAFTLGLVPIALVVTQQSFFKAFDLGQHAERGTDFAVSNVYFKSTLKTPVASATPKAGEAAVIASSKPDTPAVTSPSTTPSTAPSTVPAAKQANKAVKPTLSSVSSNAIASPKAPEAPAAATPGENIDLNDGGKFSKFGNSMDIAGKGQYQIYTAKADKNLFYIGKVGSLNEYVKMYGYCDGNNLTISTLTKGDFKGLTIGIAIKGQDSQAKSLSTERESFAFKADGVGKGDNPFKSIKLSLF